MSEIYDNWDRLVRATLRKEQLRISAQRTPSDLSAVSASSTFTSPARPVLPFNFSGLLVGKSFTYHQILQATDALSVSNLIKHGHSGDFFYSVLEGGLQVVVKRIDLSSIEKESYLISELEFFDKVSHSRFVPLLGHYLENLEYKFLVYKYMPNMDLSSSLSYRGIVSDDNIDGPSISLDWVTRLNIAIGAAQGLCYLHHECVPPLVHRNAEASSIFIDEYYEARLGRLTEVCPEKKYRNQNRISRLLRLPKGSERDTSGASNATCAYDVYCFGKVLLELVTGNSGFSDYSNSSVKDCIENILPFITIYDKELFANIIDPSLKMDEHLLIEVWAVAVVAKACLSPKPSKRPKMTHILEALEDPKSVKFSTYGSPPHASQPGRVPAPAKTRIPEESKLGVMADAKFQLKIHYGGQFLMFGENNSYVGGKVSYAESFYPDRTSLNQLLDIVGDLGFSNSVNLYHLLPDADMNGGLRMMVGDDDVLDMFAINDGRETINMYVEHFFTINTNHGAEPVESNNAGTSQETANATSSGSSTALWNRLFSEASGSEVAHQNGVIRDLPKLSIYSFSELKAATWNFSSDRVLGKGRFGRVYKGVLPGSGSLIAVKRLEPKSIQSLEMESIIHIFGRLSHPNLVELLGYCCENKEQLIVYECMQKGSMVNQLFGRDFSAQPLPWDIRLKILIGVARGLAFLHAQEIICREFKDSFILLDGSYNVKISDFDLAMVPYSQSHVTREFAAPEYIAKGHMHKKGNVYSFGVVLAELLTGLRPFDTSRPIGQHNLADWIKPSLSDEGKIKSIMDPRLEGKYHLKAVVEMAQLTRICLANEPKSRPSMKEVVDALERI